MMHRDIKFVAKNNPRMKNGDFGLDWCDKCGDGGPALIIVKTKADEFRLCSACLHEGIRIINKTILDDCVVQGKHTKYGR